MMSLLRSIPVMKLASETAACKEDDTQFLYACNT